jgi:Pex14 N-terminal domain
MWNGQLAKNIDQSLYLWVDLFGSWLFKSRLTNCQLAKSQPEHKMFGRLWLMLLASWLVAWLSFFQIGSAVKFLLNPKVAQSPMSQKRQFLRAKGLTDNDVDEACRRAGLSLNDVAQTATPQPVTTSLPLYPVVVRGPSWVHNLRDVLHLIALISGAAYTCYYFWKVTSGQSLSEKVLLLIIQQI